MACQLSELDDLVRSMRSGDWTQAKKIATRLSVSDEPHVSESLSALLATLHNVLIIARAARADMMASANRLNAAATFQRGISSPPIGVLPPSNDSADRQKFATAANSWQRPGVESE